MSHHVTTVAPQDAPVSTPAFVLWCYIYISSSFAPCVLLQSLHFMHSLYPYPPFPLNISYLAQF